MKTVIKKILKTLLIFIVVTAITYLILTFRLFSIWCNENQISLFKKHTNDIKLDSEKVQEIGNTVGDFAQLIEESRIDGTNAFPEISGEYDPLGYSIVSYMQSGIGSISIMYIDISILFGVAIAIAYLIISSKKINNIFKFLIGYIGVMLIIPPIYIYIFTNEFLNIYDIYRSTPSFFYIGYTAIFVLMYIINYIVGAKAVKELNQVIKNK